MTSSPDKREPAAPPPTAPVPEKKPEEGFLHQWSQRKHEARLRQTAVEPPPAPALETSAPAKVLTDADMPPIESLNEGSDYSSFLSPGVSETLRRQALRKLFMLPSINQRCPLDSEYYDCHGFEPLGNIITHEMREELEREAQKLKQAATAALLDNKSAVAPAPVARSIRDEQRDASSAPIETASVAKAKTTRRPRHGRRRQNAKRSR